VSPRNPHAGEPFDDADDTIEPVLQDVSIPALMCSLVHMTGDPSWIRGDVRPKPGMTMDFQGSIPEEDRAEIRRRALPAIAAYRDGGCQPHELTHEVLREAMEFAGCRPVHGTLEGMFFEDMQFEGGDPGAITWRDEIPAEVRASSFVVVVGCGESGILAGIRLSQAGLPFVIIDKNDGPGGTWWENRYPGARVDVGSHQYCYAFEPSDHWSEYYCQQPELRDYFETIVDKYGLRPHCRFGTTATSMTWNEADARWRVGLQSADGAEEMLEAQFVMSAVGSLNLPRMPGIPGMESFAGPSFHSTRWPDGLDITRRRFGLLGAGASGFRIAPTIADKVEHLTIFQRTAQWIIPNPLYHAAVPPGDRWAQRHLPFYTRWFRFLMTFPGIAVGTEPYRIDPSFDDQGGTAVNALNARRGEMLLGWMQSVLADRPDLIEKSTPDYPATGKRILQDNGSWLRCLAKPNVELVRTGIDRIVPEGVVTSDGTLHEVDIICYATGFRHNEFLAPMEIVGRGGVSIRDQFGEEPSAYLGITIPHFPNLLCMYGPGTNLAHGAGLFFHSDFQVRYSMDAIHRVLASGARSIEVREGAHADYVERHQSEISQLVWAHPSIAHSHYKNPQGKVFTLSPWPLDQYWAWTRSVDPAEYVIA